jgi:tetratricopeptide (TPR) repeat protein
MNRSGRGTVYSLTMLGVVGGMVLIGALALSLMTSTAAGPAFPVSVFGDPRTSDKVIALPAIRPAERAALPRGTFGLAQLLPLPATPPWAMPGYGAPPLRNAADSLYARVAALGMQGELDRARSAAQAGNREASMRLYAALTQRLPGDRTLLVEQASVLASFGEHARATAVLRSALKRFPRDYELQMLAARNAWWSEQPLAADTLVGEALALRPASEEAVRLRETIRTTTQPLLGVARDWARATGAPREHLLLARALVREGSYGEAIGSYRRALADPKLRSDSLLLEAASAASAADSVGALHALTEEYLVLHPADTGAVLRLARAYSWHGDYAEAMRQYRRLDWNDPALRLEVAQVLVWSGKEKEAEQELRTVIAARPRDAVALKLLGDLSLWHANYDAASSYYARARDADPMMEGVHEGLAAAAAGKEQVRLASLPRPVPDGYSAILEGFSDNQKFRWLTTRASRGFHAGSNRFMASVSQTAFEGSPTGALSRNTGATLRLDGSFPLGTRARLDLVAGGESYAAVQSFAVFGGGVTVFDVAGMQAALDYRHQPAVVRAATFAALQARATSDMVAVSVGRTRGAWAAAGRVEGERFASTVGGANRIAGSATLTRTLTPKLAASIGLSAQRVDRPSPVLPGWGNIVWAPSSYVEPTVGLAYRAPLAPGWSTVVGVQAGYGFARERAGDQRFGSGALPIGTLTGELQADRGQWTFGAGGSYGGALVRGYRAALLRVQASYRLDR